MNHRPEEEVVLVGAKKQRRWSRNDESPGPEPGEDLDRQHSLV